MVTVSEIQPPHSLLVVDASNDNKGFEYDMTDRIVNALRVANVQLTHPDALKPRNLRQFCDVFAAHPEFSALLLVTHGSAWNDQTGARLRICDEIYPWAFTTALELNIQDKLACLAICHGLNPGSGESLIQSQNQALMLVGPDDILTPIEAEGFFPPFLTALLRQQGVAWPAEFVDDTVDDHNHHAHDKMGLRAYT